MRDMMRHAGGYPVLTALAGPVGARVGRVGAAWPIALGGACAAARPRSVPRAEGVTRARTRVLDARLLRTRSTVVVAGAAA